jgi:hypothetical protein
VIVLGALGGIVVIAAVSAAATRETILIRGDALRRLSVCFVGATVPVAALVPGETIAWVFVALALGAVSLLTRARWFLIHARPEETSQSVTESLQRVRAPFETHGGRVEVASSARPARLLVSPARLGVQSLLFDDGWRENRPRLARHLLAKRFRGILPAVRIRIGGAR